MFPVGPWRTSLGVMAMYWYRLEQRLGRLRMVGATVKDCDAICRKTWWRMKNTVGSRGERVYIATTAGQDCLLGASVSPSAAQGDLTEAYGRFAQEARDVDPTYEPSRASTPMGGKRHKGPGKPCFPT